MRIITEKAPAESSSEQTRQNCWEFMQCGREPGGASARERGVCPVARKNAHMGENHGRYAGRACWKIHGAKEYGGDAKPMMQRVLQCVDCPFAQKVAEEEGLNLDP